nr:unnamed protein product [Spirometra erinaceieuropaei]
MSGLSEVVVGTGAVAADVEATDVDGNGGLRVIPALIIGVGGEAEVDEGRYQQADLEFKCTIRKKKKKTTKKKKKIKKKKKKKTTTTKKKKIKKKKIKKKKKKKNKRALSCSPSYPLSDADNSTEKHVM